MKKISIIVPAYNEQNSIAVVIERIARVDFAAEGLECEIIAVDDGSTDSTVPALESAAARFPALKIIKHPRNRGKGAAIRTAFAAVTGDIVAIQDADMEYDPADIAVLSRPIARGEARVVYGSRFLEKNPIIYAKYYLGNKFLSALISALFFKRITDSYTCRKIFLRPAISEIILTSRGFEIEAEITSKFLRRGERILEFPIKYNPRTIRQGKKISWRDAFRGVFTAVACRFARRRTFERLSPPLDVCVLSARFHPHFGGTETQGLRIASELISRGHRVFVCAYRHNPALPRKESAAGVEIFRLGGFWRGGFLAALEFMALSAMFLAARRKKYRLIQVLLASSPALVAVFIGRLLAKKVVVKFGGGRATGDFATSAKTPAGRLKLFLLKNSNAVFVCPSAEVMCEARAAGFAEEKLAVVPNGVDTARFAPASSSEKIALRRTLGLAAEWKIALYSGRFEKGKGLEGLVGEWAGVSALHPASRLVLLGSGSIERELRDIAASRGLTSVIFAGFSASVEKYLKAADIFVLPSAGEGLSNALLEAMSCALTSVATDIGGNSEVIADGKNGLLVRPGDPAAFAAALTRALDMTDQRRAALALEARAVVEAKYSLSASAAAWLDTYARV